MTAKPNSAESSQVFRQFAWHLAGSLVASGAKSGTASAGVKPRPAKAGGKR